MEVTVNYLNGKKFKAQCRSHGFFIDLPTEFKGQDEGPTPPEYFLSSIASCVGVYVLGYCGSCGLDPKGLQINISAQKAKDPMRLDNIEITINLPQTIVGQRKQALLSVAESCLIHNTIKHHPEMEIKLVDKEEVQ